MTPEDIELVKDGWRKVVPMAEEASAMFYGRLFELDPTLRGLFARDLKAQGRKLTTMISTAVVNLGNLSSIVGAVEALGRRHVGYGVQPQHYETVGTALLWTLEQGLGDEFTPAARSAWTEAYETLAAIMQTAADQAAARYAAVPAAG